MTIPILAVAARWLCVSEESASPGNDQFHGRERKTWSRQALKLISLLLEQKMHSREDKINHSEDVHGFVESRLYPDNKKDHATSRLGTLSGMNAAGSGRVPLKANIMH